MLNTGLLPGISVNDSKKKKINKIKIKIKISAKSRGEVFL